MPKGFRMGLEKVLDILGELIAFVAIVLFVFEALNNNFHWLKDANLVNIVSIANYWAKFLLIAVVGLEGAIKRNIIIRIIFYILLAAAVILLCFPGTYDALVNQATALLNA